MTILKSVRFKVQNKPKAPENNASLRIMLLDYLRRGFESLLLECSILRDKHPFPIVEGEMTDQAESD